ncbi:transient receptor potential cation channel subfamily A member 1-like, partial [Paramuricea clavata]
MSDAIGEETDNMELQPLVYENEDIIAQRPERETNGGIKSPRDHTVPPDSVDGTQNNGPVEIPEIFSPGVGDTYIVPLPTLASNPRPRPGTERRQRRYPGMDETDYEGIKDPTTDHEDEQEPRNSGLHPCQTEGMVEASLSPDDATTARCFLSKSSYLQKKCNELFFAVCYHQKEKMDEILNGEESSTLVKLLTWPDTNGRPCIMQAITRQSLNCIRPLLEHLKTLDFYSFGMNKMDALQSQCDGKNILHVAAQMVRLDQEIINAIDIDLIMNGLADNEDINGTTPLIVACQYKNDFVAQRLVSARARIDHVDHNGDSPIYLAAARGSDETLKLFLREGAQVTTNQLDIFKKRELYHNKSTILQAILKSRSPKTLQVCLDIDNGRDAILDCLRQELVSDRTFIHAVCETPLVSLVELAIEDNEHVLESLDNDDVTPLMKATEAEQLDIVELILSKDSGKKTLSWQKTSTKETALMIACKKGFHKIVKFIMENSDTNMNLGQKDKHDSNVFHHAAKHDNLLCVMIDICRRTEKYKNYKDYLNLKDKVGYVALHLAATSGSYKNVKLLLENDVPYDTLSSSSRTALHYAAFSNIETVEALLEFVKNKIDKPDAVKQFIDAVDSRLQTSLHIAASFGKWQTVSVLLDNGAAIKCDEENETALHLASFAGCTKTVKLLIRNQPAIVKHENRVGETAAMFAALGGQTEVLKILFDNKAKLWAESHGSSVEKRKTCLDWAVENNKPDTAKAILEHTNWKETMEKSAFSPDGLLAMMVKSMPNVAIDVLNKCEKKEKNKTEYDFFALQTKGEKPSGEKRIDNVTAMEALGTMAENSRIECLNHAVVQKFMEQKWSLRARKWYLGCLSIYATFLLSFTAYISLFTQGYASDARCMIISRIICYVFATLNIIRELLQ